MKSQPAANATHVSGKSDLHKVTKTKTGRADSVTQEEMQALLAKLKDLVPNMPKNRKLSKLEIIQYVIDYIVDLQNALETHPAARTNPFANTSPTTVSPNRQPLGVLSPTGNSVANTCTNVELSHLEKIPAHLAELVSGIAPRQVSC